MERLNGTFCVNSLRNNLSLLVILLVIQGICGCSDPVAASEKNDGVEISSQSQSDDQVKTIAKSNDTIPKKERIQKEKAFEAGLSKDEIKALITITPGPISTTFEGHSSDPYLYYNEFTQSLNYVPGETWQSVNGSAVTFYITNPLKYTHIDLVNVKISGKTLKREDDMYVWPVTFDSKTETVTDLKPGESRKITMYFETEVDIQSRGGAIAGIGAGFSNAIAKAGKAAGNKGFRVAMNPDTIRFDLSNANTQYVGDFDEKLKAIIESVKTDFKAIRNEDNAKEYDSFKRWSSNITLPYTSGNQIRYWKKNDNYEFAASIIETESTNDGRKKAGDFIDCLERALGNNWTKNVFSSDSWDIHVVFYDESTILEIIGQKYTSVELYQAELKIKKMKSSN